MRESTVLQTDPSPLIFQNESELSTFTENMTIDAPSKNKVSVLPLVAGLIFGVVYILPILESYPTEHTCLALLCTVAFLWSTEGIPAYASAYLVPIFCVWFGVGIDSETHLRIKSSVLASTFAWKFMDPIIFVFLGSMTMSTCLSKLRITDRISGFIFKHLSKNPKWILLTLMLINLFIAAFLSNVASTTLVLSLTMPIIRSLDPNDPFIKAFLFGIAWSGNCGGMPTTIASPQNVLALQYMESSEKVNISFTDWMCFGFPLSILICVAEWLYLVLRFKPLTDHINVAIAPTEKFDLWSVKHTYACIVTVLTIVLWTLEETLSSVLGNVGITALLPVIAFFGSGMLSTEDFHSIRWSTLSLMGGGLALGEAMKLSGLLDLLSSVSGAMESISMWPLLVIFLFIEGILGSLINSTSAASILYPVIAILGRHTGHVSLFVCLSAIMISGAQLFHISSFPNALVSGVCKHVYGYPDQLTQETFLEGPEYFKVGWLTMIIAVLIISSIGYGITLGMKL